MQRILLLLHYYIKQSEQLLLLANMTERRVLGVILIIMMMMMMMTTTTMMIMTKMTRTCPDWQPCRVLTPHGRRTTTLMTMAMMRMLSLQRLLSRVARGDHACHT